MVHRYVLVIVPVSLSWHVPTKTPQWRQKRAFRTPRAAMPPAPTAPTAPTSWFFAAHPVTFPRVYARPIGQVAWTACALGVLGGLCIPRALSLLGPHTAWPELGAPPLHTYLVFWALFHMLEFTVTAYWNETHLQSDCTSPLLT